MASRGDGFSLDTEDSTHYVPFFSAYRLRDLTLKIKIYQIALIAVSIIAVIVIIVLIILSTSCKYRNDCPSNSSSSPSIVTVFYAGSLVDVMSRMIGPGVLKEYNIAINATSAASGILAAKLENGASVDLFISASTSISAQLLTATYNSKHLSTWCVKKIFVTIQLFST